MLDVAVIKNRQIEGWLATLIEREDREETARVAAALDCGLLKIAQQFQAHEKPVRRKRLARDLAAILRLHGFLLREREAANKATVTAIADRITAWIGAVNQLQRAIGKFNGAGTESLAGSLSSLTALEIVLETVLEKAIGADGIKGKMLRSAIAPAVDALLAEARYNLLIGCPRNSLPLLEIEAALRQQTAASIAEAEEPINDEWACNRNQASRFAKDLAVARRAASLTHQHGEADGAMIKAARALDMDIQALTKSDGAKAIVPSAEEAYVWGLTLLVDGWRPRTMRELGVELGRPMTISLNARGHVADLARKIGDCFGLVDLEGPDEGKGKKVFGTTAVAACAAFHQRGRHQHIFSGRRLTGLKEREFRPDRYDRLTQEEAAVLIRQRIVVPEEAIVRREPLKRALVLPQL